MLCRLLQIGRQKSTTTAAHLAAYSRTTSPRPRATIRRNSRVLRPPDDGVAAKRQPSVTGAFGGRGPPVVDVQTVRRVTGDSVFWDTGHRGLGAHTDRGLPGPGHWVAHVGRVPPGR